uniref:Uncharacterized protein n=1 Tax=Pararge aegeria TaxID=116150 RepID=S4PVR2_9NEOP
MTVMALACCRPWVLQQFTINFKFLSITYIYTVMLAITFSEYVFGNIISNPINIRAAFNVSHGWAYDSY